MGVVVRHNDTDDRNSFSTIRITGVTACGESVTADIINPLLRVIIGDTGGTAFETLRTHAINQLERARVRAIADFDGQVVSHSSVTRSFLQGIRDAAVFVEVLVVDGWAHSTLLKHAVAAGLHTAHERVEPFDIECYSQTGDFPKATNREDRITMIGVHLSRAHDASHSRVLMFTSMPCAPLEGAELRASASEREMLDDFIAHMGRLHPEVYVSYKGFGFDWGYIFKRAESYGLDLRDLGAYRTSRKMLLIEKDSRDGRTMQFFSINGALNLDVLVPIHADYKLPCYKLDTVLEVATYCVRDVELPFRLMHSLSLLLNKLAESETVNTTLSDLVTRGQGIKIFSYIAQLSPGRKAWAHRARKAGAIIRTRAATSLTHARKNLLWAAPEAQGRARCRERLAGANKAKIRHGIGQERVLRGSLLPGSAAAGKQMFGELRLFLPTAFAAAAREESPILRLLLHLHHMLLLLVHQLLVALLHHHHLLLIIIEEADAFCLLPPFCARAMMLRAHFLRFCGRPLFRSI
ncbi:ribonuclease H-like domain-containing protein [Pavlovales sp. CCMP2436]|nr:ribonuclease H-like domain-containing protein [Pavlovales sp. CCMP2436]